MRAITCEPSRDVGPRAGALVAGGGMLAMAIAASLSLIGVIEPLTVLDDPTATAANITASPRLVRIAAGGLLSAALLDIVVAWGLHVLLRQVNPSLSLLAAWLRLAYAAIFAVAIANIFAAARTAPIDPTGAALQLEVFNIVWQSGLIVFGAHLLVVGALVWQAPFVSRAFGILLMIAGGGYAVDATSVLLNPPHPLGLANITFVGEVLFMVWLLIAARKPAEKP